MLGGQVGIPDCHLDRFVTHQFLDRAEVNSRHDQPAGEGMPETMPCELLQFRVLHSGIEPEPGRMQPSTVSVEENVGTAIPIRFSGSQSSNRSIIQRNMPRLAVLAAPHRKLAALKVHAIPR